MYRIRNNYQVSIKSYLITFPYVIPGFFHGLDFPNEFADDRQGHLLYMLMLIYKIEHDVLPVHLRNLLIKKKVTKPDRLKIIIIEMIFRVP